MSRAPAAQRTPPQTTGRQRLTEDAFVAFAPVVAAISTVSQRNAAVPLAREALRSSSSFAAATLSVAKVRCTFVVARASARRRSVALRRAGASSVEEDTSTAADARVAAPKASRTSTWSASGAPAGSSVRKLGDDAPLVSGVSFW